MKKKTEKKLNNNEIYTIRETIQTTPEDGVVRKSIIRPLDMDTYGKYHKGYSVTKSFSTNNPRFTRPLVYGICSLFFIIGLVSLLLGGWFFGIIFIGVAIFTFTKSKKDIDAIAEKLENDGHDVTIDSTEELEQTTNQFTETVKSNLNEVTKQTFTKDKLKWFIKTSIPIYCIITLLISIITFFINIFLGLFILIASTFSGLFYYYLISKIFKH